MQGRGRTEQRENTGHVEPRWGLWIYRVIIVTKLMISINVCNVTTEKRRERLYGSSGKLTENA